MPYQADKPYNDLPLLPPKAELESKAILKKCVDAARALAELKGAGKLIPDPSVLINSIPLREAQASSEIENIVTTADALFRAAALDKESDDPAIKEVLRYRAALKEGFEKLGKRPISKISQTEPNGVRTQSMVHIKPLRLKNKVQSFT